MKFRELAAEELKRLWQRSQSLAPVLEEWSPRLHQRLLSYVSELSEPFVLGMGLQVKNLDDEHIDVILPARWRSQAGDQNVHPGALVTLADATAQFFWKRHLDPSFSEFRLKQLESQFLRQARGELRARIHVSERERERLLFELRRDQRCEAVTAVRIFNGSDQIVAEMTLTWQLLHRPALPSGGR